VDNLLARCIILLCLVSLSGCASPDQASQPGAILDLEQNDPGTVAKMYVYGVVSGECDEVTKLVAFDYQSQVERVDCVNNSPKNILSADVSDVLVREMDNRVVLVSLVGTFYTGKDLPMCTVELKVEKVNDDWYVIPHIMPGIQCTPIPSTPTLHKPTSTPIPSITEGDHLGDFLINTLDGTTINSQDLMGKAIVIVSWKADCPYSKKVLPVLQKYYDKYSSELVILGLNYQDSPETIRGYITENEITFPIWLDPEGVITTSNGIDRWPITIFINQEGYRAGAIVGAQPEEVFNSIFQSLGLE
jgi:thiol-disulfide isomerase/thioredoxin